MNYIKSLLSSKIKVLHYVVDINVFYTPHIFECIMKFAKARSCVHGSDTGKGQISYKKGRLRQNQLRLNQKEDKFLPSFCWP